MNYSLVMSDEVLKEFIAFKNSGKYDAQKIEKILHYYKPVYLTNVEQLKRIGYVDNNLFQRLAQSNFIKQSIEELADKTLLKVILDFEKSDFPYINVIEDKIENNLTGTFYVNENRDKAKAHIKSLLFGAKTVFIYDRYLKNNFASARKFFDELMPKRQISIYGLQNLLEQRQITQLKQICSNWEFKQANIGKYSHDRYILIDKHIEIILTSGIDYLFDDNKDFTYIIRIVYI